MSSLRKIGAFAVPMLVWAARAQAEDTSELQSLLSEQVVSTASKMPETSIKTPATSRVISADEIRALGIESVGDAIGFLAPGMFQHSDPLVGALGARGVMIQEGVHFLVLVNGHALNDPYRGGANVGPGVVPIELVDRIEVVLGAGSVLYGSNATLGVINVITKDAREFSGVRVGLEVQPFVLRPYVGAGQEIAILGARGEVTYELQYRRQRGPYYTLGAENVGIDPGTGKPTRFGRDPVGTGIWGGSEWNHNDADQPSGHLKLRLGEFTLNLNGSVSRVPFQLDAPTDYNAYAVTDSRRLGLDLLHRHVFSTHLQLTSRAYADTFDQSVAFEVSRTPVCPFAGYGLTCRIDNRFGARWAGLEVQPQIDWLGDGRLVTLLGVDGRVRNANAKTDTTNAADTTPLLPSVGIVRRTDATLGSYLQQTWQPAQWVWLNGGARLDYDARFDPVLSPRAAAGADLWSGGNLKLIYSQAFRAPTFEESFFAHPLQPAPDRLDPERITSREAVLTQALGAQRISMIAFSTTFDDLIARHRLTADEAAALVQRGKSLVTPEYQVRNTDSLTIRGFTFGLDGSASGARVRYGGSVTSALIRDTDGDGGEQAPRVFGNGHVMWTPEPGGPTFGLAARWASSVVLQNADSQAFAGRESAPPILDLRTTISGPAPFVPGLHYRASIGYSFNGGAASLIGPIRADTATQHEPLLMPLEHVHGALTLEQRF
jgi:outer membrane receptor for ferrienterochelin and colicins